MARTAFANSHLCRAAIRGLVSVALAAPAAAVAAEAGQPPLFNFYKLIHAFTGAPTDGALPSAGVVTDSMGRLYGTTAQGGAFNGGVIYRLTPPSSNKEPWTEEILHSFDGFFWP